MADPTVFGDFSNGIDRGAAHKKYVVCGATFLNVRLSLRWSQALQQGITPPGRQRWQKQRKSRTQCREFVSFSSRVTLRNFLLDTGHNPGGCATCHRQHEQEMLVSRTILISAAGGCDSSLDQRRHQTHRRRRFRPPRRVDLERLSDVLRLDAAHLRMTLDGISDTTLTSFVVTQIAAE